MEGVEPPTTHANAPAVRIDALDMFVELLSQVEDDASSDAFYSRLCEATCALTSMTRSSSSDCRATGADSTVTCASENASRSIP